MSILIFSLFANFGKQSLVNRPYLISSWSKTATYVMLLQCDIISLKDPKVSDLPNPKKQIALETLKGNK